MANSDERRGRALEPVFADVTRRLEEPRVAVPLLLLLAVVLRLPNLGESLWFDEVVYSTHYRSPDLDRLWALLMRIPGPPLYPLLAYFWAALVGEHEVIVRLPSLICGLGSIVLAYFIARRFSTGGAAFLAGLLLCLSPAHIWYSQEAAPYAMTMFFLLAAVFLWPRVTTPPVAWRLYVLYVGVLLAAVFTHFYAAVFLLPLTLLGVAAPKPVRVRVVLAPLAVMLALAAWLAVRQAGGSLPRAPEFLRAFTLFEWWMLFFHWFLHGNSLWTISARRASTGYLLGEPLLLALQIAAAVLVLRGLWPGPGKDQRGRAAELGLYVASLPLVVYVLTIATGRDLYIERYLILSLPFFMIALAIGATRFARPAVGRAAGAALIVVALASYAAFRDKDDLWTVYKQNPDWRGAVTYLHAQNVRPDELLLVGVGPLDDFVYYVRKQWPERRPRLRAYNRRTFHRLVEEAPTTLIVLVRNRFITGRRYDVVERLRDEHGLRATAIRSFKAVDLYSFVPRSPAADRAATP